MEKTWLIRGRYYADVILTVNGETLEQAVENGHDGQFLHLDYVPGGYQGFDWDGNKGNVEVIDDVQVGVEGIG